MNLHARNSSRALTRLELLVVVIALSVVMAVLFPGLWSRPRSRRVPSCSYGLGQIEISFRVFAHDNDDRYPMQLSTNQGGTRELLGRSDLMWRHFQVLSNELAAPKFLVCPADLRRPATNFALLRNTNISYFVGLDADPGERRMVLAGDRNLQRDGLPYAAGIWQLRTNHEIGWAPGLHTPGPGLGKGVVVLVDGSRHGLDDAGLRDLLRRSGDAYNRIAIP